MKYLIAIVENSIREPRIVTAHSSKAAIRSYNSIVYDEFCVGTIIGFYRNKRWNTVISIPKDTLNNILNKLE